MAENLYGGSSVQVSADSDWPNLEHTHEDTAGFLDYGLPVGAENSAS